MKSYGPPPPLAVYRGKWKTRVQGFFGFFQDFARSAPQIYFCKMKILQKNCEILQNFRKKWSFCAEQHPEFLRILHIFCNFRKNLHFFYCFFKNGAGALEKDTCKKFFDWKSCFFRHFRGPFSGQKSVFFCKKLFLLRRALSGPHHEKFFVFFAIFAVFVFFCQCLSNFIRAAPRNLCMCEKHRKNVEKTQKFRQGLP